jgi:hypothetical protein
MADVAVPYFQMLLKHIKHSSHCIYRHTQHSELWILLTECTYVCSMIHTWNNLVR